MQSMLALLCHRQGRTIPHEATHFHYIDATNAAFIEDYGESFFRGLATNRPRRCWA